MLVRKDVFLIHIILIRKNNIGYEINLLLVKIILFIKNYLVMKSYFCKKA